MNLFIFFLRTCSIFINAIWKSLSGASTMFQACCNRVAGLLWRHIVLAVVGCTLTLVAKYPDLG